MTMKKYIVYLDDGKTCYKIAVPAKDEKSARQFAQGNGEVIAVKEVTKDFPISASKVGEALLRSGFGECEMDFVVRALREISICDMD